MTKELSDKEYIGTLLSKPPFDAFDCATINFLRNDMHSKSGIVQDVRFFDMQGALVFSANVMSDHSFIELRTPAILWALQDYHRLTGELPNWASAQVGDNYSITEGQLNELLNSDDAPTKMFLSLIAEDDIRPAEALGAVINSLTRMNDEGQIITPHIIDQAFRPVHAALLNQSKSSHLTDAQGKKIEPPTTKQSLLLGLKRKLLGH